MIRIVPACVFPGQGSQSVGMLSAWRGERVFVETIDEASDVLDLDLWHLSQHADPAELARTVNTQPLVVAASIAIYRTWQAQSPVDVPWAIGHSVGEISALVAAGALALPAALHIARQRALAMMAAVAPGVGGMAAVIGLDDLTVERLCSACAGGGGVLEPVNFNAPGQVVVAGHMPAIERLKMAAREAGAKMVFVLPVSGPFHSSLMQPAAEALARCLDDIRVTAPSLRVLHGNSLEVATEASIKPALVAQLTAPVRWTAMVRHLEADGVTHIVESGPGEVLTNLCRRVAPALSVLPLHLPQGMEAAVLALS